MDALLREKLETLDGSRRRNAIRRAAVRIEDVERLLDIADKPRSRKAAGDPPTKEEHDALVADVHDLHRMLAGIAAALQRRVLR